MVLGVPIFKHFRVIMKVGSHKVYCQKTTHYLFLSEELMTSEKKNGGRGLIKDNTPFIHICSSSLL